MADATVFIIVMHFAVSLPMWGEVAGRVLPDGRTYRAAFATKAECDKRLKPLLAEFEGKTIKPKTIICERLEIRR